MIYQPYNGFQQMPNPMIQNPQPTMQQGFITIRNEQEIFNYPVAPGNSVSFKHENKPYIYIKTMGLSQFDRPSIVKYKLTEEELGSSEVESNTSTPAEIKSLNEDDLKPILDDLKVVHDEIDNIKKKIDEIDKAARKQTTQNSKEK